MKNSGGRKNWEAGGKKIFTGERAANKRKTLNLKNLHPLAAVWKVKNPSFHLLCSRHLWKQKKKAAPLLWPWESKPERTPHKERAASHPFFVGGPKPEKPLAEGGFWFLVSSPFSRASLPLPHLKSQHSLIRAATPSHRPLFPLKTKWPPKVFPCP